MDQASSVQKEPKHASIKTYIQIAVILAIITIIEVAYPYTTNDIAFLNPFYIPVLAVLSLAKFVLVVGYYMHLRYDPPLLNGIFIFSLVVALSIAVAMLFLFQVGLG